MKNIFPLSFTGKEKKISYEDLSSLNELLRSGLSIRNALRLLKTKRNEVIFESLLDELGSGRMVEEAIDRYLPKKLALYIRPLVRSMTFADALDLSLSFYEKGKENEKALEKAILYPFILLFVSLSALYLFDAYGLDTILEMLRSFNTDLSSFSTVRILLRIVVYVFYIGLLAGIGAFLYFSKDRNIALFYIFCSRYLPNSIFQIYYCEEFVSLFLICLEQGYRTKEALSILKALHNKPVVSFLAFHLDEKLLQGATLKEASVQSYYDESLSRFINVAVYTNEFSRILSDYVKVSRQRIAASMKRLATVIQIASYLMIGAVIVFIYQVLFLPMQAIISF
ncbi:MAG: type II secretion system F family protein [Erysipelotrichaceae bacterium]|nr:type II secretion system F family protein [Erysipelotrichaceae bacterium]